MVRKTEPSSPGVLLLRREDTKSHLHSGTLPLCMWLASVYRVSPPFVCLVKGHILQGRGVGVLCIGVEAHTWLTHSVWHSSMQSAVPTVLRNEEGGVTGWLL